jgi:hypothetical protein
LEETYGLSTKHSICRSEAGLSSGNVQGYNLVLTLLLEKLEQVLNYSFKKKIMKKILTALSILALVSCQSDDAYERLK